jgi:polysaccharide biosynthesis protein PslG
MAGLREGPPSRHRAGTRPRGKASDWPVWSKAVAVTLAAAIVLIASYKIAQKQFPKIIKSNSIHFSSASAHPAHPVLFGMSDPELIGEPSGLQVTQLKAMRSIGITSIRLEANWGWVQYGGPRTFYWTQLDQEVNSARAAGISVDLVIDGCPSWAAVAGARRDPSPQPASSSQYARWAAEVAARYAPKGVRIFEIWNEPNLGRAWQPRPNPAAYTADLVAAYSAIKEVDPSAFVVSGGLAAIPTHGRNYSPIAFLRAMYADGARGSFDALGFHPYTYPMFPNSKGSFTGWSFMDQSNPSLRSVMIAHGDGSKPIWITEFGAPSSGWGSVGARGQAIELKQAISDAKTTSWIGALYIYTWQDMGNDPSDRLDWFGLLTAAGSPKPAYAQVAAAIGKPKPRSP